MQYSRQRIKTEGPIYNPTHLYEPLRNAIKKSQIFESSTLKDTNFLGVSGVSHFNKSISQTNASKMRGEVIIPNKALVATQNLERVRGKTFSAVNIEQRVGHPLSEEQFRRFRTGEREQIVYEMREGNQIDTVFTYTAPNTIKGIETYARKDRSNKGAIQDEQRQDRTRQKPSSSTVNSFNVDTHSPKKYTYSFNEGENEITIEPSQLKAYMFMHKQMKECPSVWAQQKKYNLFSLLDECGNNGCHKECWKGNQIIAPKFQRKAWK